MTFITKRIVGDDERVLASTTLHPIYLYEGILWMLSFMAISYVLPHLFFMAFGPHQIYIEQPIIFMGFYFGQPMMLLQLALNLTGVMFLVLSAIRLCTTEVVLTGGRLIHKHGWIFVDVEEIDLSEITAEYVHHGSLGRFLSYGTLHLDCRFVADVYLPAIRHPHKFLQATHKARTKIRTVFDGNT